MEAKKTKKNFLGSQAYASSWDFISRTLGNTQQTKTNKRLFSITHYYSRISVNIWYWSQRSRSPAGWPCRRHTKRLLLGLDREPPGEQVPGVEMRLSQVSDVSGVSSREGGSADLPLAPAASPHLKDTEAPEREMLGRSSSFGSRTGSLFAGGWSRALRGSGGHCFHFWAAITSHARWLPPTGSARQVRDRGSPQLPREGGSLGRPAGRGADRLRPPGLLRAAAGLRDGLGGQPPPPGLNLSHSSAPTQPREGPPGFSTAAGEPPAAASLRLPRRLPPEIHTTASPQEAKWHPWIWFAATFSEKPPPFAPLPQESLITGYRPGLFPPLLSRAQWKLHFVLRPPRNAVILRGTRSPAPACASEGDGTNCLGLFTECQAPQWIFKPVFSRSHRAQESLFLFVIKR